MRKFARDINNNLLGNIKYHNNIKTGVIAVDNGNYTYDVFLSSSTDAYPNIPTTAREPDFTVNDPVEVAVNNGNQENMIIIGLAKKIVQEVEVIDINPIIIAHYLFTIDYESGIISKHEGISETVLDTFPAPNYGYPTGVCNDGTNLINCEDIDGRIYIHDGVTSGISSYFSAPSTEAIKYPSGLAYDGTNLISCDLGTGMIYVHSGVSSGITSSFNSPSTGSRYPRGLAVISGNLISADANSDKIYVHNGISSGVTSSFSSPTAQPNGLGNYGSNLLSADNGTYGVVDDHFYLHSGVSSGITTTFDCSTGYKRISGLTYI